MHHGVEVLLEVDPLAEAVGADQHVAFETVHSPDPLGPLLGWKIPGDRDDGHVFGQPGSKLIGQVLGGGDETAEDDGPVPGLDQFLQDRDRLEKLRVTVPLEPLRGPGQLQQPLAIG